MRSKSIKKISALQEPLAIIGFAFKFPSGIEYSDSFWQTIINGENTLADIPEDRFNLENFRKSTAKTSGRPQGYHIKGNIAAFDAPFFSITAEEAVAMDPQQRLLLETTYQAIENAGITLSRISGSKTSVHVGCLSQDYYFANARDPENAGKYAATGTDFSILANRLSWFYNLKGPSLAVQTACSSSLVALDLACQLLRSGETNMGIVSGVSLMHMPDFWIYLDNMGFLSPDSRCHSFDSRANGYARAEGFGVVLIKRLSDAIRDNDTIRTVIRSTGSNSDGYTPGLTQPNGDSQVSLIRETYEKAGLSMEPTRYCEAHGTGTVLGDPIEAHAIGSAFRSARKADDKLYIGASKANFGHLEAASGIVGIIKTLLVLEHGIIPPIADLVHLNPNIDHEFHKLEFPKKPVPWPHQGLRRASINSFGFGGTNAHVVMDDAYNFLAENMLEANHNTKKRPSIVGYKQFQGSNANGCKDLHDVQGACFPIESNFRPYILPFSAADSDGVKRIGDLYSEYFSKPDNISGGFPDICRRLAFTLEKCRSSLAWRSCAIVNSFQSLTNLGKQVSTPRRASANPRLALAFTGQGAQYPRMGIELLKYDVFAQSIDRSAKYLKSFGCSWDLNEEISKAASNSRVYETDLSQPLCTALQIALVDLLERINMKPAIVIGHSSGEVAAAYCKGAISQESAMRIAYYRGLGGAAAAKDPDFVGTMMAVGLGEADILPLLHNLSDIYIGCINSPNSVTVSGGTEQINALKSILDEKAIFNRKLPVPCAYHSPHMIGVAKKYLRQVDLLSPRFEFEEDSIKMVSYLDGQVVSSERLQQVDYWMTNMYSPVNFTGCVNEIDRFASLAKGKRMLDLSHRQGFLITNILEIGPHSALRGPLRDIMKTFKHATDIQYDPLLVRGHSALDSFLTAISRLHCCGFNFDLSYLNNDHDTNSDPQNIPPLVDLPAYPFMHTRTYWKESRRSTNDRFRRFMPNELVGTQVLDFNPFSPTWRNIINVSKCDWIEDHKINNVTIYPGAGMIAMAIEAMNQYAQAVLDIKPKSFSLQDIEFVTAMQIPKGPSDLEIQICLRALAGETVLKADSWFELGIFSLQDGHWQNHCKGLIRADAGTKTAEEFNLNICNGDRPQDFTDFSVDQFYSILKHAGYGFGQSFQRLSRIKLGPPGEIRAEIKVFEPSEFNSQQNLSRRAMESAFIVHPTTLDAVLQTVMGNPVRESTHSIPTMIPTKIKKLWISSTGLNHSANSGTLCVTAQRDFYGYRGAEHSIHVANASSQKDIKMEIAGYELIRVLGGENDLQDASKTNLHTCWHFSWEKFLSTNSTNPSHQDKTQDRALIDIHVYDPSTEGMALAMALRLKLETETHSECQVVESMKAKPEILQTSAFLKIILWDIDGFSPLATLSKYEFEVLQKLLDTNNHVLWIQTSDPTSIEYPSQHLVEGLASSVSQENLMASFVTLSLASKTASDRATTVFNVAQAIFSECESSNFPKNLRESVSGEIEYRLLRESTDISSKVRSAQQIQSPTPVRWDSDTPMRMVVGCPGVLDTIHFVEDRDETSLKNGEVEVEVKAIGLNFKDCLIALGIVNENTIGSEIAGIVTRVGPDSGHGLKPGDRVCGFALDGYRTFFRSQGEFFARIPESLNMTFNMAASIPINFATAWHSLRDVANLTSDETVLIHSGAGGTGQAAIQIAKYLGATVFATVSTGEKRSILTKQYGIPPNHIFNSRDVSFAKSLMRLTGGRGVDVVFNSLSGDKLFRSWEILAPYGRFVEIGKRDIQAQNRLPMGQFEKNCSFSAVDLGYMFATRPKKVANIINEVLNHFEQAHLQTVQPLHVFSISQVVDAFRLMQTGKSSGKIVVEVDPTHEVLAILALKQKSTFDLNAAYVIAGGLGGIGRDIAIWMANKGAKTLVLLSRSGPRSETAVKLVAHLTSMGVRCITPVCDISDYTALKTLVGSLDAPIKGCIQASMVLRSALFAEMSHEEWNEATAPKVTGSWNLHSLLPRDLDFFILLSSVQGFVGSRTQGNYAAGNTYMDALAFHRVSLGLKTVSLQIGLMSSDGYMAEHQDEKDLMLAQNTYLPINRSEFHTLLDHYCDQNLEISSPTESQLSIGLRWLHKDPELDPPGTSWGRNPMFKELRILTEASNTSATGLMGNDTKSLFGSATTDDEASKVVLTALAHRLALIVASVDSESTIDHNRSVQDFGVDSLQTMELRGWLLKQFGSDVPTFEILGAPNLISLAEVVTNKSTLRKKSNKLVI
ncbi:hypothetical protein AA313_de0209816 [Arthrobotrys entomopaga]|nr:hypothetical protein AA313_de0209816 [Arthrobotrys entomopaga]